MIVVSECGRHIFRTVLFLLAAVLVTSPFIGSDATGKTNAKRVNVMVAGPNGPFAGSSLLKASATTVRAGKKRCKVAANTPLSALVASSRRSNFGFRIKDFGSCSKKLAANSSQLFVNKVGSYPNKGSDGWFFKVNDKAGTTGSADPSGPFGSGRLSSGDRVVWFYCKYKKGSGSCQRTLRLISSASARKGKTYKIKVVGYDDSKRGRAISKVRASIGGQTATTDKKGRAFLKPLRKGKFKLFASRKGMVSAFPRKVRVM